MACYRDGFTFYRLLKIISEFTELISFRPDTTIGTPNPAYFFPNYWHHRKVTYKTYLRPI
jgi:hypothetical protein